MNGASRGAVSNTSELPAEYRPGTCNIDAAERRRRRQYAVVAAIVAVTWVIVVAMGLFPDPSLLIVFVPVMLAIEWTIEAQTAFCVRLAVRGKYRIDGTTSVVDDPTDRSVDAARAVRITISAAAVATVVTALVYVIVLGV